MARVHVEDLDARDSIAESAMCGIIRSGDYGSYNAMVARCYDIAEAFLAERQRRLELEADDDEGEFVEPWRW